MKTTFVRNWFRATAIAGAIASVVFAAQGVCQQIPESPRPKLDATAAQGPAPKPFSQEWKRTPLELFLGFKPNLQPLEIPENARPLQAREKYAFAFHQAENFKAHAGNVVQAALSQAFDSQPHYGQGWGPYAQRYGAAEADQVTSCFFIYGFFPHLLHTDPRYFRKKRGSVWSRMAYAAAQTFITRRDAGGTTFNSAQIAGQLFQSGISTAYYPASDRGPGQVFQSYGLSLLFNSGYNVAAEFYPDLWQKVFHRK